MNKYQAYSKGAISKIAENPRGAALAFFESNPNKRKCNIIEGKLEGGFFVVTYEMRKPGGMPRSYSDVTKKSALTLL